VRSGSDNAGFVACEKTVNRHRAKPAALACVGRDGYSQMAEQQTRQCFSRQFHQQAARRLLEILQNTGVDSGLV
jgi:hypothetical protein